jgi:hypothetical protein
VHCDKLIQSPLSGRVPVRQCSRCHSHLMIREWAQRSRTRGDVAQLGVSRMVYENAR